MFDFYNEDLKILNFTHIDFDGAAAAVVVKNYYKNVIVEQVNYNKEQDIIDKLYKYKNKIDAIVFTDFTPINLKNIQAFKIPVMVLDHHESALPMADPKNGIFINTKYCGAMFAYKYYGIKKDLSKLSDLITIANDFDLFTLNDPRSMCFNALFWEMGFKWFIRRFIDGNTNLYNEEKRFLMEYKKNVQTMYDNLSISDLPHNGVFYECDSYMAEMSNMLAKDGYQYQVIKHNNALSLRSATDRINLLDVCKYVGKGGGHRRASGIFIEPRDNIADLVQRVCFGVEHALNNGNELPF